MAERWTEVELRERVERFVKATPRDAVDHLLICFFVNAILADKRGKIAQEVARGRI